jgi:hypothetical protein
LFDAVKLSSGIVPYEIRCEKVVEPIEHLRSSSNINARSLTERRKPYPAFYLCR